MSITNPFLRLGSTRPRPQPRRMNSNRARWPQTVLIDADGRATVRALDGEAEVSLCPLGQFATASYFTVISSDEALPWVEHNACMEKDRQNKAFHVLQV